MLLNLPRNQVTPTYPRHPPAQLPASTKLQYKRMSLETAPIGEGLLWGGAVPHPECAGYGVVYFADKALRGRYLTRERGGVGA